MDKTVVEEEVEDGWGAVKEEYKDVTADPGEDADEVEDLEKGGESNDLGADEEELEDIVLLSE